MLRGALRRREKSPRAGGASARRKESHPREKGNPGDLQCPSRGFICCHCCCCLCFGYAMGHVESYFPDRDSNQHPLQWKHRLNHWTAREVPGLLKGSKGSEEHSFQVQCLHINFNSLSNVIFGRVLLEENMLFHTVKNENVPETQNMPLEIKTKQCFSWRALCH